MFHVSRWSIFVKFNVLSIDFFFQNTDTSDRFISMSSGGVRRTVLAIAVKDIEKRYQPTRCYVSST
mgnify:CR=1 FL=1